MYGFQFFICRWVVGVGGRLPHFSTLTRESMTQKKRAFRLLECAAQHDGNQQASQCNHSTRDHDDSRPVDFVVQSLESVFHYFVLSFLNFCNYCSTKNPFCQYFFAIFFDFFQVFFAKIFSSFFQKSIDKMFFVCYN